MIRFLLFLLFLVLLVADTLGMNLSLAPGFSVKNAFLYMLLLGIAINTALARNRQLELVNVIVPYGLAILFATFSWLIMILLVRDPNYQVFGTLIRLKGGFADHLLVFLVFFYGVLNSKDAMWLLKAILWIVVVVNILSVIDYLNVPNLNFVFEREDGRLRGPIEEPNQYAAYLVLFLPAIVALIFVERGLRRLLAVVGFVMSVLALIMTGSRGGIVGIIGGGLVGLFYLRRYVSARHVMMGVTGTVVLCVVAGMVLYFVGAGEATYGRIIGQTASGTVYDASSGRTFLWSQALGEMFAQPYSLITGFGWEAYRQLGAFRMAPHNTYLKIYFELGLVGLFLIVLAFWNVLSNARDSLKNASGEDRVFLLAFPFGLLAFLAAIFFVDIHGPWIFAWAFVGVSMRIAILQRNTSLGPLESAAPLRAVRDRDAPEPG